VIGDGSPLGVSFELNFQCFKHRSALAHVLADRRAAEPPDHLPAREMVLHITGNLFTHRRQLKHFVFHDRIISLLGGLQILGCFVSEIVRPFHVVWSMIQGKEALAFRGQGRKGKLGPVVFTF
jgi:hypothetical protein